MASSKLSSKGTNSRKGIAAISETQFEMHDGKLTDDEQMRMMLTEERISTMAALGGYGLYPFQSNGQLWPGMPNHFNTFFPYPPHLMAPPYGQTSNEPLDLRIPQKRLPSGDATNTSKKRCSSGGEIDSHIHKQRRNEILQSFRNDVTRDTTVGAKRIKRRSSSSRRWRKSPAVPLSMVPPISALDLYNNNDNEQEKDRNCANCDENRKSAILTNGHEVASRDLPTTPEGVLKDEDVAAMLFRPIPPEHSLVQDKENADEAVVPFSSDIQKPDTLVSGPPTQHSDSDIPVCGVPGLETNIAITPDSDIRTSFHPRSGIHVSVTPVSETPAKEPLIAETNDSESDDSAHNMSEPHAESLDEADDVAELRSENLAFKQMLENLSGEVEKLKKMIAAKKQSL